MVSHQMARNLTGSAPFFARETRMDHAFLQ